MSSTDQKFAVIVPYRDREYNLAHLILHLQWYLDPDSFDIFVVEQADSLPFNRGCTMNIGFQLARAADRYSHYVFHDVDLIPLRADFSFPRPAPSIFRRRSASTSTSCLTRIVSAESSFSTGKILKP